jgi:hypothetical protein
MEQQVESKQRLDSNQGDLSGRTQLPIIDILFGTDAALCSVVYAWQRFPL